MNAPSKKLRILLVDEDGETLRGFLRDLHLVSDEDAVVVVRDGASAFRLLSIWAEAFDVLIADEDAQTIGGFELAWEGRSRNPNLQVILFSDFPTEESKKEAHRLGAFAYLERPLAPWDHHGPRARAA